MPLPALLREVLALAVPPACAACGGPLLAASEAVCAPCRRALPWLRSPRCERCALPWHGGSACPAAGAGWERAWAPLAHAGPARELVRALKFRGALPVAEAMAAAMVAGAPPGLLGDGSPGLALVPVPAHPARRRARGFDQAEVLARAVGARAGLPVARCLRRAGAELTQLGSGRRERLARGRIDVRATGSPPARALLVDDVHTTGATLRACAAALLAEGALRVDALTYTRALGSRTIRCPTTPSAGPRRRTPP